VFPVRYELNSYIFRINSVFKGLILCTPVVDSVGNSAVLLRLSMRRIVSVSVQVFLQYNELAPRDHSHPPVICNPSWIVTCGDAVTWSDSIRLQHCPTTECYDIVAMTCGSHSVDSSLESLL
jgi:hypothetical protein